MMYREKKHRFLNRIIVLLFVLLISLFGSSSNAQDRRQTPYRVPLSEIAEKLEYQYIFDNMLYDISSMDNFDELGTLPTGESIPVTVYITKGNRILFLPNEKMNTEVLLNGVSCGAYYSEQNDGYLFYTLMDWVYEEGGVPVNTKEDGYYKSITDAMAVNDSWDRNDGIFYRNLYSLEDTIKLGEIEVTFDPEKTMELLPISVEGNEYIDSIVRTIKPILKEKNKLGTFKIYLETNGRTMKYNSTSAKITGAVTGEGIEQYFAFEIVDYGEIEQAWPYSLPYSSETELYFVSNFVMRDKPADLISRIIGLNRGVISFEVTEETEEMKEFFYERINDNSDIDFSKMSAKEAASWIEYSCSYSEWFGMNELGYVNGEVSGFDQKEMILYLGGNNGDTLYFVPKEKVNSIIIGDNGAKIPLYLNKDGEAELFYISKNLGADKEKQIPIHLIKSFEYYGEVKNLVKIGEERLTIQQLSQLSVPKIVEDEYIRSLEKHVKELLAQAGKNGAYKMYVGEYEALGQNQVGLSAAVIGEEEYYFRYMIVKSQTDQYYFWPIGFGLNGSLEECKGEKHYMNRLCIERTKQLNRCEIDIDI